MKKRLIWQVYMWWATSTNYCTRNLGSKRANDICKFVDGPYLVEYAWWDVICYKDIREYVLVRWVTWPLVQGDLHIIDVDSVLSRILFLISFIFVSSIIILCLLLYCSMSGIYWWFDLFQTTKCPQEMADHGWGMAEMWEVAGMGRRGRILCGGDELDNG